MEFYSAPNIMNSIKNIDIIGDETSEILQVVLNKNESIIINQNYLSYISSNSLEEIPYADMISTYQETDNKSKEKKTKAREFLKLKNVNDNFEYLGLTKNGKIMKILPLLYKDLFVRSNSIIAFSDNLDLIEDNLVTQPLNTRNPIENTIVIPKNFLFENLFYKIKQKKKNLEILNEIDVLNALNQINEVNSLLKEYLFLSSEKFLMEKRLGEHEQIILLKKSIVAFEQSVHFTKVSQSQGNKKISYVNPEDDIIIEGPGLVIYEPIPRNNKRFYKPKYFSVILVSVLLLVLQMISQYALNINI